MARGRHSRPSGLLAWLLPEREARRRAQADRERALLNGLRAEVLRLHELGERRRAEAALAAARAQHAEERALRAAERTRRAEEQAHAAQQEATALRTEVGRLRARLLEVPGDDGRVPAATDRARTPVEPARVVDLRPVASG